MNEVLQAKEIFSHSPEYKNFLNNTKPTMGLLLCKSRDKFEAEYSLKRISSPIGVSEFKLTRAIPENLN